MSNLDESKAVLFIYTCTYTHAHVHLLFLSSTLFRYYGRKCLSHLVTVTDFEKIASRTLNSQQWPKLRDAVEALRAKVQYES